MSEDLYLIAHRVRGAPAFDIAIILDQIDEDNEVMWIIPTSGHRAYPYWWYQLDRVFNVMFLIDKPPTSIPTDLPDHYHLEQTTRTSPSDLLSRLNLRPTQPPIVRRF